MSKAKAQGFSPKRLHRIDRFLEDRYIANGRLPCAHVQVLRRGELVHEIVLGQRDVERGLGLQDDTIHRIYSMTKPVTSLAFMMLVEEGLVALDDPVAKYIPAWKDMGVFVAGYGIVRILLENVRNPDAQMPDFLRHWITMGMILSIPMVLIGAFLIWNSRRMARHA